MTGVQIILPLSMRYIISKIELKQSVNFLIIAVIIYALFLLLHNIINVAWYKSLDRLGGKLLEKIRADLYQSILKADYISLLKVGKEKIKNILFMDTLTIFSSVALQSVQIFSNTILISVFLILSAFTDIKLTFGLIIACLMGFLISNFSRTPIKNASKEVNIKMKEFNKISNEYVDALELTKTNELNAYFINKSKTSLWSFINTALKSDGIMVFLKNLLSSFHQLVSLILAAVLTMTMGVNSTGDLVFYLFISDTVINMGKNIEDTIYLISKNIPVFDNVAEILDMPKSAASKKIDKIHSIKLDNISFGYEVNKPILTNLNAEFTSGDVVKIIGSNGGGKSTLIKIIIGLLQPQKGRVTINGISSKEISSSSLRKEILYIDQDEIILNDTIKNYLENISGEMLNEKQISQLMDKVGFDKGISEIKENGHSLSGGQRKKLMLMKLLLCYENASVIILDELEAGLDKETKAKVEEIEKEIISMRKDAIILKISHELKEDDIYNKILSL